MSSKQLCFCILGGLSSELVIVVDLVFGGHLFDSDRQLLLLAGLGLDLQLFDLILLSLDVLIVLVIILFTVLIPSGEVPDGGLGLRLWLLNHGRGVVRHS